MVGSVVAMLASFSVAAAGECRPPKDSSEAKLLAFFAAPIAFSPAGNAGALAAGAVRLSFDATYVPQPSADIRRASYCNRKSESTDLTPVFPRPRLAVGLGGGLYLEGSWLPPVTVMDATPNLGSVALGWVRPLGTRAADGRGSWISLRAHATFGKVEGAITCSDDALQQQTSALPCYGNEPSSDTYRPNMIGGEGIYGFSASPRLSAYAGVGYTSLRPRFQVGFTNLGGTLDDTKVLVDLARVAAFAGGRFAVGGGAAITAELYSVPQDVTTFRVGGSLQLRRGAGR